MHLSIKIATSFTFLLLHFFLVVLDTLKSRNLLGRPKNRALSTFSCCTQISSSLVLWVCCSAFSSKVQVQGNLFLMLLAHNTYAFSLHLLSLENICQFLLSGKVCFYFPVPWKAYAALKGAWKARASLISTSLMASVWNDDAFCY